jgi:hypothetical protein
MSAAWDAGCCVAVARGPNGVAQDGHYVHMQHDMQVQIRCWLHVGTKLRKTCPDLVGDGQLFEEPSEDQAHVVAEPGSFPQGVEDVAVERDLLRLA